MRFMMLMIPKGYETAAPGTMPAADAVAAMMKYNEALKEAGVLITLEGLHPPSMGARVSFSAGKAVVTDGPFAEAKEVGSFKVIACSAGLEYMSVKYEDLATKVDDVLGLPLILNLAADAETTLFI